MKRFFHAVGNLLHVLFTGGRFGPCIEGKLCPKCGIRRIKLHKKCCGPCYDKYYA
jgi:hypothetical protein